MEQLFPTRANGQGQVTRRMTWCGHRVDIGGATTDVFSVFDGVFNRSDVWVNGVNVGQHQGGFAAFVFDVTANLAAALAQKPGAAQAFDAAIDAALARRPGAEIEYNLAPLKPWMRA